MKYTDKKLREMLLKANHELYCLTDKLVNMGASSTFIHNVLHTTSINDVEEDVINRLDRYKRIAAVLSHLKENGGEISHKGNVYFFNEEEGVAWGTFEELLSDDSIYNGEAFVLTVDEIVPKLLKPLLDKYIEEEDVEGINGVTSSICYVFEFMLAPKEEE